MKNHESKYHYEQVAPMSYQEWADAANHAERVPVLPMDFAGRLKAIFSHKGPYSPEDYRANLRWLQDLELQLRYVWSTPQREASGMERIVSDFIEQFGP